MSFFSVFLSPFTCSLVLSCFSFCSPADTWRVVARFRLGASCFHHMLFLLCGFIMLPLVFSSAAFVPSWCLRGVESQHFIRILLFPTLLFASVFLIDSFAFFPSVFHLFSVIFRRAASLHYTTPSFCALHVSPSSLLLIFFPACSSLFALTLFTFVHHHSFTLHPSLFISRGRNFAHSPLTYT